MANLGGSAWSLLQLISGLDRDRFEPVVGLAAEGPLADACRRQDFTVLLHPGLQPVVDIGTAQRSLLDPGNLRRWLRRRAGPRAAADLVARAQPDLVHLNASTLFHLAPGARAAGARRIVLHIREHWRTPPGHRLARWRDACVRSSIDRLVAISRTDAEQFGHPERTTVIHNWPDFTGRTESVDLARAYDIPPGAPVVLALAGRNPIKGGLVMAEALRLLRNPDARFLLLDALSQSPSRGAAWVRRQMRRVNVRTYGMRLDDAAVASGGRLLLAPATASIRSVMEQAAVVVCPFTQPHFAKAAIEAGSLGRPVVISDGGEARETVRPNETGLLVPASDPRALAEALDRLLADPALAARLGEAARRFVGEHFSREHSLAELQTLYAELLETV